MCTLLHRWKYGKYRILKSPFYTLNQPFRELRSESRLPLKIAFLAIVLHPIPCFAGSDRRDTRIPKFGISIFRVARSIRGVLRRLQSWNGITVGEEMVIADWSGRQKEYRNAYISTIGTSGGIIGGNLWKRTISLLRAFIPITTLSPSLSRKVLSILLNGPAAKRVQSSSMFMLRMNSLLLFAERRFLNYSLPRFISLLFSNFFFLSFFLFFLSGRVFRAYIFSFPLIHQVSSSLLPLSMTRYPLELLFKSRK